MIVNIEGIGNLRFGFQYEGTSTKAYVRGVEKDDPILLEEVAHKSKHDRFVKSVGRRVALNKLLMKGFSNKRVYFTRERRKQVWAEYFKIHADLKGNK